MSSSRLFFVYPDLCVKKKFGGFTVGQKLALVSCRPGNRKQQWVYNSTTGLISHFSDRGEWLNFCVQAKQGSGARVRIANCDATDVWQVWDFNLRRGHVHLRNDIDTCIMSKTLYDNFAHDDDNYLKTTNKCVSNSFGVWEG